MLKSDLCTVPTNVDKIWTFNQYYVGERDAEKRRNGFGENHWTGAESLEWYTGRFLRDTMHGEGEYRSRYRGDKGVFVTYEGHFYANRLHGYGAMSYPDGAVFTGIFHKDLRWGPGIESQACLRQDVGLWRGNQLVRLAWKPATPNVVIDLYVGNGKATIEAHRVILTTRAKTLGKVNSAIELLKQYGAEPRAASEKWRKLYPKNCTDLASQLCHVELFEREYYRNKIPMLEEVDTGPNIKQTDSQLSQIESSETIGTFYAWNNNEMMKHMMQHCFTHESQRAAHGIDLKAVFSGPRSHFKRPGKHENECRTLLEASFLGHIASVAQLVNELKVYPDVADMQGNTALFYATCGDQVDTMHFLVEAGADVNSYCDNCYTPLGVALLRYACARKDISASGMVQALTPPFMIPSPSASPQPKPLEWQITRDLPASTPVNLARTPSRIGPKSMSNLKKLKSSPSEDSPSRKKSRINTLHSETDDDMYDQSSEDIILFNNTNREFTIKVSNLFTPSVGPIPYVFEMYDMMKDITAAEEEIKPVLDKNAKKAASKVLKDIIKPSKEIMWQNSDRDEFGSISSAEKIKIETLSKMMLTIQQLLSDGADPCLVRCPQPALLIAAVAGSPELVRYLVHYGADVNEVYPNSLYYTALDIAVSKPLTYENVDLVRTLLECGAKTDHLLRIVDPLAVDEPGPTLLHVVLAKSAETETEEEFRRNLLELLLEYNCDPMVRYQGRSAADVALHKGMDVFDVFLKCPQMDLNETINDSNQSMLVKMFSTPFCKTVPTPERLQTITNLLLFGSDPLIECQCDEVVYKNIFVFAKKTLSEMGEFGGQNVSANKEVKSKKSEKLKKDDKSSSTKQFAADDIWDYKQALDVMTECARMLHIRWLQAKLFRDLHEVVVKYKHRQWNMIFPEHKNKKTCGLWLTCSRILEIWDLFSITKKKLYNEPRVLKHMLCIVQFYVKRAKIGVRPKLTAEEKDMIESKVKYILHEHRTAGPLSTDEIPWARPYVTPELDVRSNKKFDVCFECVLPLDDEKTLCSYCKLVSFCSTECMKMNTDRAGCHPCSEYLRIKYFPSPDVSTSVMDDVQNS